jgi:hypothetical protein
MSKINLSKLVKQPHIQDLLAYGLSAKQKPYYTIRDSIATADQVVIDEVPELFGCSWEDLKQAALAHCDLDKKYYPVV